MSRMLMKSLIYSYTGENSVIVQSILGEMILCRNNGNITDEAVQKYIKEQEESFKENSRSTVANQ
jgi:hypothetical protein